MGPFFFFTFATVTDHSFENKNTHGPLLKQGLLSLYTALG